jgi:sec-independent protein translocase protein TatA
MGSLSPVHWVIVLVIVLLLFGPGRLAGVGKGLGEGIRSFKKGLNEDAVDPPPTATKPEEKQLQDKQVPENRSS